MKRNEALGRKFEIFKTVGRKLDVKISKVFYDQTQNPMFLMRIYQICREHNFKFPGIGYADRKASFPTGLPCINKRAV